MSQEIAPPNYDHSFQQPQIIITDVNDVELYRYESADLWPAGTQDFLLNSAVLHYGVNDDHGSLGLNIQDDNLTLTDSNAAQTVLIPRYSNIQLNLGKTLGGLSRWFYGKIMHASVFRPNSEEQEIDLFCAGWGQVTKDRLTNMQEFQKLLADNITADSTDTATRADILFSKLWESQDHYVLKSLPIRSEITSSPVVQAFKFKQFEQRFQSWAAAASAIAAGIGGYWGIDYDRNAKLNKVLSVDSGFLFTSDFENVLTQNWNSAKLGLITKGSMMWTHSVAEQGYNVLVAHGVHENRTDIDTTGTEDAVFDLSTFSVEAPFIPLDSSLSRVGVMLRRNGTPPEDAFISLMSATGAGLPNLNDIIKRIPVPKTQLQNLSDASDSLIQVGFDKIQVVANDTYYLRLEKYGTATNGIEWAYEAGAGQFYKDGVTLDTSGKMSLVTNPSRLTNVILVNTTALRKAGGEVREKIIPLRGGMNDVAAQDVMIGLAEILSKERRLMPKARMYIPDTRIPTGEYCIITDNRGLKLKADIIGVNLSINAFQKDNSLGAMMCDVALQVYE